MAANADQRAVLRIPSEMSALETQRSFVEAWALELGAAPSAVYDLLLAINELVTNIIMHGYHDSSGMIEIEIRQIGRSLEVFVRDAAPVFDPTTVPAPDTTLPLDQRPIGGLGLHMARHFVDSIAHRALLQGGNELIVVKRNVF